MLALFSRWTTCGLEIDCEKFHYFDLHLHLHGLNRIASAVAVAEAAGSYDGRFILEIHSNKFVAPVGLFEILFLIFIVSRAKMFGRISFFLMKGSIKYSIPIDMMTGISRLLLDEYKYSQEYRIKKSKTKICSNCIVVSERHSTETGADSSVPFCSFDSVLIFT